MPQCNLLQNHMCVRVDGTWSVCCKFMNGYRPSVEKVSFEEFRDSLFYREVVETMKTKWHPGCVNCLDVEKAARKDSLREYANKKFSTDRGIESIEFSMSNDCNLRCRMCGPKYSTKWVDLIEEHPNLIRTQLHDKYSVAAEKVDLKLEDIVRDVDFSKVKDIKYLGGEPFISPQLIRLFEYLDEIGVIGNIEFQTNTNCTFFPEKLVPYLRKFRYLVVTLSIDGYGELNDYIRDGKPWKVVEEVALKWARFSWSSNLNLIVTPSVQAYNVHDIINIQQFAKNNKIRFKTQNVIRPKYLSLNALPTEYLKSVENLENTEDIQAAVFNPRLWEEFKKHTKDLDVALGKSIKDYIPKLYEYF